MAIDAGRTTQPTTQDIQRQLAVSAARDERIRQERLLARVDSDRRAKVERPPFTLRAKPPAFAEKPEPSPYEKFGGVRG